MSGINTYYDGSPVYFLTDQNHILKVEQDEFSESPREWSNLGVLSIACDAMHLIEGDLGKIDDFLSHYKVKQSGTDKEALLRDLDSIVESAKKRGDVCLPVSVYDHGGISFYIGKPTGQWDNYLVGFIYVTAERIKEEYGGKRVTKKLRDKVENVLAGEISDLDDWTNGNIWGFRLYNDRGEEIDSCCGYLGDDALSYIEEEIGEKIVKFISTENDVEVDVFSSILKMARDRD